MGGDGERPPSFKSLVTKWKKVEDRAGAKPFATAAPKKKKSVMAMQNEEAVRKYKQSLTLNKKFKNKAPTRGMSVYNKPAQLQNVFGAKMQDLSDYQPPSFEKSKEDLALIRDSLMHNFFFDDISEKDLAAFLAAFEPITVKKETVIIKAGDVADYFYVLSEGLVSFFTEHGDKSEGKKGACFGELALLYACPRAATVVAESEPTCMFRVDQKTFKSLLQKQQKILTQQKMELLRSIDFLKEIDGIDLKRLGDAMTPKQFESGTQLVKKGEEGDAFYIIKEGEVKVHDISVGSNTFDDIVLKQGAYFGERALATKEPRAANVTAISQGIAFCIDRATFEKVLGKLSRVIMTAQDKRVMVRTQEFVCRVKCSPCCSS